MKCKDCKLNKLIKERNLLKHDILKSRKEVAELKDKTISLEQEINSLKQEIYALEHYYATY